MADKKHALLSPSSADCWMQCAGAPALYQGIPNPSSKYADEGNLAHEVGEMVLKAQRPAADYIGHQAYGHECDESMAEHVQSYADTVMQYLTHPSDVLHVEVELDISTVTGETDAVGTSDAVILSHVEQEIVTLDLKYGQGVKVKADDNRQLMIYALAVLEMYELIGDWKTVRLVIIQPRAGGVSEWVVSVDDLRFFGETLKTAAALSLQLAANPSQAIHHLSPSAKACKWCRYKPECPALRADILSEFDNLDNPPVEDRPNIGELLAKVELIEDWCRAIRTEAERRLHAGSDVTGFKLVEGKRGNRAWNDEKQVEALLKAMRLKHDQIYQYKVISPTTADKLLAKDHPKQWAKVQAHITQKPGSPTVAPVTDPRPALPLAVHSSTEFEAVVENT